MEVILVGSAEEKNSRRRFSEFCQANKIAQDKIRWKFAGDSTVAIALDKKDACEGGFHLITIGIAYALRELGVEGLDITLRAQGECLDIIVEK